MTQRYLVIERSPRGGEQRPTRVHVPIQEEIPIGPWMTTLAGHLGYPLVDRFGAPMVYRLRARSERYLLPTTGRFADVHFPSGSCFVLEPQTHTIVPLYENTRASVLSGTPSPFHFSRRFLITGGTLSLFSMLGLGSGMTTAFAQRLLRHEPETVARRPTSTPAPSRSLTISVHRTFTQHQQTVRAITWAPEGRAICSGGDDTLALIWQWDGPVLHSLPLHAPINALAWSPDGIQLGAGAASMVAFFDTNTGSLLSTNTRHHPASVTALGWATTHPTVPLAISAGTDKKAIVWNGQSHQPQIIFERHTTPIEAIAVLGEIVATASQGGVVRVWNALSGQEIHGFFSDTQQSMSNGDADLIHRHLLRILDYLDGSSYSWRDVPSGSPWLVDPLAGKIGLINVVPNQEPPGYLAHVDLHVAGLASAPGHTSEQQQVAIAVDHVIARMSDDLMRVRRDAAQLVQLSDVQLGQPDTLTVLNEMAALTTEVKGGWLDPKTNEDIGGVLWISAQLQQLASIPVAEIVH